MEADKLAFHFVSVSTMRIYIKTPPKDQTLAGFQFVGDLKENKAFYL